MCVRAENVCIGRICIGCCECVCYGCYECVQVSALCVCYGCCEYVQVGALCLCASGCFRERRMQKEFALWAFW